MNPPLLELRAVTKRYRLPRERLFAAAPEVTALDGVSLMVRAGTSLGIVGESGSGKSTLARLAIALEVPTAGSVHLLGRDLHRLAPADLRAARRDFQMVFQDPYGSLDPRQRVGRIVAEPLDAPATADARRQVGEALDAVGLRAADAGRYPHEFSGGQRQRIAIARALITRPRLIVADEPVSALDVSVQAQVLNLFADLQAQFGVTYLFISHDLAVVDQVCDEVAVLYAGRVVEHGPSAVVFAAPAHPYTRALLASMLGPATATATQASDGAGGPAVDADGASATLARADRVTADRAVVEGSIADGSDADRSIGASASITPSDPPSTAASGCAYIAHCAFRRPRCATEAPRLRPLGVGRSAACHVAESVLLLPPPEGTTR